MAESDRAPRSQSSLVDALRHAILVEELHPGQRLVEQDLAIQFNATRGAVREALVLLENEGLAARQANRGAWVRPVSLDEAIEITEVRAALEGICAAKASQNATEQDRTELRALCEAIDGAVAVGDIRSYSEHTHTVHLRIRAIAAQRTASDVLERLSYRIGRYRFSVALLPGRPAQGAREHLDVVEAVVAGDADAAEKAMRDHLANVVSALRTLPATDSVWPWVSATSVSSEVKAP